MKRRRLAWVAMLLTFLAGCGGNSWSSGDRVLVSKYTYDAGARPPNRFDVVVFRCPESPQRGGPLDNFIKRLLGLAGETLAIFFGQVFVTTDLDVPDYLVDEQARQEFSKVSPLERWRPEFMFRNSDVALQLFQAGPLELEGKAPTAGKRKGFHILHKLDGDETQLRPESKRMGFHILHKPPDVMLALRRIVYDNDFPAKDLKEANFPARWAQQTPGTWDNGGDNSFEAKATSKSTDINWLIYQHILRPLDWPEGKDRKHRPQLITDFSGYNSYEKQGSRRDGAGNWVGDLMVEFQVKVERPEGELWLELARGVDRFRAGWDLTSGKCTLWRLQEGKGPEMLKGGEAKTKVSSPGTYLVRFANFDQRLTLWVDRAMPFGDGVEYSRAWYYDSKSKQFVNTGPTVNDLKPASIGSKGASVRVSHLKLWRNTYYTSMHGNPTFDAEFQPPAFSDAGADDFSPAARQARRQAEAVYWEDFWGNPENWKRLRELHVLTLYVQKGHYLCLGDNSPESHDSRAWGAVPERLMLGRALVVYYPFSRAGLIR
jgi:type IV secretory pathway protease TraF